MSDCEDLHESQKPYRVFVSLLDEWDIGYPVIQAVFLDALKSLKRHVDSGNHGAEVRPRSKSLCLSGGRDGVSQSCMFINNVQYYYSSSIQQQCGST